MLFSCGTKESNEIIIEGFDVNYCENNNPLLSFVDTIDVVAFSSNENIHLSNPEKVIYHKKNIYILDNNRLIQFNSKGEFKHLIGERGHGHGEYINIATFAVHNDTISLIDSYKNTMLHYTLSGKYLYETIAPEGTLSNVKDATFEEDNILFIANYIYNEENNTYTRWNIITNKTSVVDNAKVNTYGTKEYIGEHSFCQYRNNIRYIQPFSSIVKSLDGNDVRLKTSRKVLTESELFAIKDYSIMTYFDHLNDFTGFNNVFETDKYLLLTFSNLEYVLVDKTTKECIRYSYGCEEDANTIPLLNILSSTDNLLIGVVNIEEYNNLKNILKKYCNIPNDMMSGYMLIMYHVV